MAYQKDISAILGLSISTVSKALKGYSDISEETRQRVLRTAEDLDYRFQREDSVQGSVHISGAVGLIAPALAQMLESGYYRRMLLGMAEEAAREKRDLVIMGEESAAGGMSWSVRSIARRVDGLCILARGEDFYRGRFAQILENNFPVVSIEHEAAGHIAICSGQRKNIRMMLTWLKSMGHCSVALTACRSPESKRTGAIFRSEAEKLAMGVREVEESVLVMTETVGRPEDLEASCVVFRTCEEAEQAVRRWEKAGWNVPGDISAAALEGVYDGFGREMGARIACVRTDPAAIGREAVRRLIGITEHPETDSGERILVSGELNTGETVADLVRNTLEKVEQIRKLT